MTTPPATPQPDLQLVEYPAGARFIGPGDDVVISAEKLEEFIQEQIAAQRTADRSAYQAEINNRLPSVKPEYIHTETHEDIRSEYAMGSNNAVDKCKAAIDAVLGGRIMTDPAAINQFMAELGFKCTEFDDGLVVFSNHPLPEFGYEQAAFWYGACLKARVDEASKAETLAGFHGAKSVAKVLHGRVRDLESQLAAPPKQPNKEYI